MESNNTEGKTASLGTQSQIQSLTGVSTPINPDGDIAKLYNETARLTKESQENLKETERIRNDVENAKNLVYLGFIIVIIMLGALVITYFFQIFMSYNTLVDKVNSLEIQLNSRHK